VSVSNNGSTETVVFDKKLPTGTNYLSKQCLEIYRNQTGGTKLYKYAFLGGGGRNLWDITGSVSYFILKERDLGIEFTPPDAADEPYPLMQEPSICVSHQGVLIASGFDRYPNRIFWETPLFKEGFPLATNFKDIKIGEKGKVTAIWSESQDTLAVFKPYSYYAVLGEFTAAVPFLTTEKRSFGDFGVSSQEGLEKVGDVNIAFGTKRIFAFNGGKIDNAFGLPVIAKYAPRLLEQVAADTTAEVIIYTDVISRINSKQARTLVVSDDLILFYAPNKDGVPRRSEVFYCNVRDGAWGELFFKNGTYKGSTDPLQYFLPDGGMFMYDNKPHFIGNFWNVGNSFSSAKNFMSAQYTQDGLVLSGENNLADIYHDTGLPIPTVIKTGWLNLNTPSAEKDVFEIKVFVFQDEYEFVKQSLTIRLYKDNETDALHEETFVLDSVSDTEVVLKFTATKCKTFALEFEVEAYRSRLMIVGFEVNYLTDYLIENFK
jgi:hypothetical protein